MTVGLPGAGVGGIFYLVSALTMPVRELARTLRGESSPARWRLVTAQWALALGILFAMWATGKGLGLLIAAIAAKTSAVAMLPGAPSSNVLKVSAFVLSFGTLALVWTAVQVLRVFVSRRDAGVAREEIRNEAPSLSA